MSGKSRQFEDQSLFHGETNIHIPGNLRKSVVVYPTMLVGLQCGFTEFPIKKPELRLLVEGTDLLNNHLISRWPI